MKIGIYSPNWIGDAVLAIPFIQSLKEKEQDAEIIIICKDWVSGVFENHPEVNQIISFPNIQLKGLFNLIQVGMSLKKLKLDKFYTLTDSFRSAFILWLSGAQQRYGYGSQMRSIFLTDVRLLSRKEIHRSKKYMNLVDSADGNFNIPKIHLTKFEKSWAEKEMGKLELSNPIALFPFSVASNRNIPTDVLIKWIKDSKNNYLVFGSKDDIRKGEKLIKYCDTITIRSICGKYSLRESIALISVCNYVLATDSGLGHLSAAMGLPTISFFGVGIDAITSPIGKHTKIIKYCSPCLGILCKEQDDERVCIKEISRFDIEFAVNGLTN
ncbi:MAG: lipopolysaccharide heptosyltransferase II [Candidatus Neomarinimicrobiota bacterium]